MEVIQLMLGDLQTNCYIIINDIKECVIVDPGAESGKLIELLRSKDLKLNGILITHGHFDHIGGVDFLKQNFGVEVFAHIEEAKMMSDASVNLSRMFSNKVVECKATKFLKDNETIELGKDLSFKVIEVPGHTSHSLCFLHADGQIFTGDTLFNSGVGRTDWYDGPPSDLMKNIKKRLFSLAGDIKVYPGHGMTTTINQEMKGNPFF